MPAYYNEYDPFAAATLRELIADGLICDGIVDDRSIELVQPSDLKGFTQVHLFAGFGIWSLAARLAGWGDNRPIWSASCPCPPFSTAGKIKACPSCGGFKPIPHVGQTGFFLCSLCGNEWLADARHLWPEVWRLIRDERPPCIVGEQVASADGRTWLDLVSASMDIMAYDTWGVDTCAAGFGAPHIRQRLYWVADTESHGREKRPRQNRESNEGGGGEGGPNTIGRGDAVRLANANGPITEQLERQGPRPAEAHDAGPHNQSNRRSNAGGMDNANSPRHIGSVEGTETNSWDQERVRLFGQGYGQDRLERPGPTNGLWEHSDWLRCTDEKWRPVESGTFPLADAGAFRNRVAELRGAGNAVNVAQAAEFIRAIMHELP